MHKSEQFVRFGKAFRRYETLPGGEVRLHFEDGTMEECDLLVGADGVGSKVRKQFLPHAEEAVPGVATIYFKIPLTRETMELLPVQSGSGVMVSCAQLVPEHQTSSAHPFRLSVRVTRIFQSIPG